jgi:hypothetical protein
MTAQQLLDQLLEILPAFRDEWCSADNLFRNDDGSFTECGVFVTCSHFIRANYERLSTHQRSQLGSLVAQCMRARDTPLSNAAATCFLENLSGEVFAKDFENYLAGEALDFYRVIGRS